MTARAKKKKQTEMAPEQFAELLRARAKAQLIAGTKKIAQDLRAPALLKRA
jgi:hypothetical protein